MPLPLGTAADPLIVNADNGGSAGDPLFVAPVVAGAAVSNANPLPMRRADYTSANGWLTTAGLSDTIGNIGNSTTPIYYAPSGPARVRSLKLQLRDTTAGTGTMATYGSATLATAGLRVRVMAISGGVLGATVRTLVGSIATNIGLLALFGESRLSSYASALNCVSGTWVFASEGLELAAGQALVVDQQTAIGAGMSIGIYADAIEYTA